MTKEGLLPEPEEEEKPKVAPKSVVIKSMKETINAAQAKAK